MISFKEFLEESALQRKIEDGSGDTPLNVPGAEVIHHDPEKKMTVYHAKTPNALATLCSGLGHCVSNKKSHWPAAYIGNGNVFVAHVHKERITAFMPHRKGGMKSEELVDEMGSELRAKKKIGNDVLDKLRAVPHNNPPGLRDK
jgi:hypothetical protein